MDTTEDQPLAKIGHNSGATERLSDDLSADLLFGAEAIAAFVGVEPSQIYYIRKSKKLPIGKLGKILIASRRRLKRAAADLTA